MITVSTNRMPRRISHQSEVSETSEISDKDNCDKELITKIELQKNKSKTVKPNMPEVEEVNENSNTLTRFQKNLDRGNRCCNNLGLYSFVTAVGVGFVAYAGTHIYVCFCAPTGFWGFVQSLVVMDSTFCQMLLGLIHHSQSLYAVMLLGFLFSFLGAIQKCVQWCTGRELQPVPATLQSRPLRLQ